MLVYWSMRIVIGAMIYCIITIFIFSLLLEKTVRSTLSCTPQPSNREITLAKIKEIYRITWIYFKGTFSLERNRILNRRNEILRPREFPTNFNELFSRTRFLLFNYGNGFSDRVGLEMRTQNIQNRNSRSRRRRYEDALDRLAIAALNDSMPQNRQFNIGDNLNNSRTTNRQMVSMPPNCIDSPEYYQRQMVSMPPNYPNRPFVGEGRRDGVTLHGDRFDGRISDDLI